MSNRLSLACVCANPSAPTCEVCNCRVVCKAEIAGVCVPVYVAMRDLGIAFASDKWRDMG